MQICINKASRCPEKDRDLGSIGDLGRFSIPSIFFAKLLLSNVNAGLILYLQLICRYVY